MTDKWINKVGCIDTMEHFTALKEILHYATAWISPDGIILSEVSQSLKDKYCVISFIWALYSIQIHRKRE